jgi:hypothetical protein
VQLEGVTQGLHDASPIPSAVIRPSYAVAPADVVRIPHAEVHRPDQKAEHHRATQLPYMQHCGRVTRPTPMPQMIFFKI